MKHISTALFIYFIFAITQSHAADNHNHDQSSSEHDSHQKIMTSNTHKDMRKSGMFLIEKMVDDYKVSFHVMEADAAGMQHGGSHNLMVKIEQNSNVIDDAVINSKVIHPNKQSESKPLMKMGDWYMNGYDLGHSGQHQLMILFKTADGKKHKAGVHYPE